MIRCAMPEETNKPQIIYDLLESGVHANPDGPTFLRRRPGSDNSFHSYTYTELKTMTDQLIAGWVSSGLKSGDRVLLLCDPSSYWFVTDTSILSVGAVSVPRATDVTDDDILYIANHSEASLAVVQTVKTAEKLRRLADFRGQPRAEHADQRNKKRRSNVYGVFDQDACYSGVNGSAGVRQCGGGQCEH